MSVIKILTANRFNFFCRKLITHHCTSIQKLSQNSASGLHVNKWYQFINRPLELEPGNTSVILFPGQGAQFIGMGKELVKIPKVREMFQAANEILRTNIMRICLEGPVSQLSKTIHTQPATFIISLASLVKLQEEDNELIKNCVATAGYSVGEIGALVFSGALTFEQGLHIVRIRAELMQRACDENPGAMITVFTSPSSQLKLAMKAAVEHCSNNLNMDEPHCSIASYLYPDCKVLAGHVQVIEFIEKHKIQFGLNRVKRLPVSGAFHTQMMSDAYRCFANNLDRMDDIRLPDIPVISGIDAAPYVSVENIKQKLALQLIHPVRWEQTLYALYKRPTDIGHPRTVELGPGRQLGFMLRMCDRKAYNNYHPIDV